MILTQVERVTVSRLTAYLVLAIFPLAFFLGFSFNPIQFSWAFHHGLERMPVGVRDRAAAATYWCSFLTDALTVGCIALLMLRNSVAIARVGLHLKEWAANAALGVVAAILLILSQLIVARLIPTGPGTFAHAAKRSSVLLSAFVFLAGAFSEELWIAFCLVALRSTGHSSSVSVAVTAIVFGAVHYQYGFGGASAIALKGALSALLFLWSGSLLAPFTYHFIGNLGSFYRARGVPDA